MKLLPIALLLFFLSVPLMAAPADPACAEFRYIQKTMKAIDAKSVEHVIPYADWLDKRYRREDMISAGSTVARTVVMLMLHRLNVFMYIFTPSRAEAATVSGSYVRNPQAFVRFLQLTPERACPIMRLGGSDTERLRNITHEVFLELRRASR